MVTRFRYYLSCCRKNRRKNVYLHCMSTTVTLCFENVIQNNPAVVYVGFELATMKESKEIF